MQPHRRQPTRLPRPWDSPGKNTGVGCHFLLQCMKVKSESEVTQSCPTSSDPMDCSPRGSSIHGICQARVLEWGAIAFSQSFAKTHQKFSRSPSLHTEHGLQNPEGCPPTHTWGPHQAHPQGLLSSNHTDLHSALSPHQACTTSGPLHALSL